MSSSRQGARARRPRRVRVTSEREILEALEPAARILGTPLTTAQLRQVVRYLALLSEWRKRARLTAITRPREAARLHILDSLLCLRAGIPPDSSVLDVGSGAGLPGIPLAIARPDLEVTLLEAVSKKVAFLEIVAAELGLSVQVVASRAEEAARQPRLRERFDVVVARAVAPLPVLSELTLPFVRVGGKAVLLKGPGVAREVDSGQRAAVALGGGDVRVIPAELPGRARRALVEIAKVTSTPLAYPRRPGMPAKRPLGG